MAVDRSRPAGSSGEPLAAPGSPRRAHADLFLVSVLILFFELACIRWFGSMVVFLSFFTNIVLMACFLGMSVGCLAASRRQDLIKTVLPTTLLAAGLAAAVLVVYNGMERSIYIDVGNQASPQQIYFGTENRQRDPSQFVIPIEAVAGVFFALIALMFIGMGQVMGRAFNAIPNRVAASATNLVGSLVGIAAFGAASWFRTSPIVWFTPCIVLTLAFVRPPRASQAAAALALLGLITFLTLSTHAYWSPYYKIQHEPRSGAIITNNMGHQYMTVVQRDAPAYALPYLLARDAGAALFDDVLVIGAGSGNDVASALMYRARHVDAVEIDPVISEIGRDHHPNRPYSDPRVTIHHDDGRSFLRKAGRKYDLIVYALVDSLVLQSGYSSIRLESFLFTEQAFRDVRARLKPGGVFAMYNFYRQGWVVGRLEKTIERAFDAKPIVISLPYQAKIVPSNNQNGFITILLVGDGETSIVNRVRDRLRDSRAFWVNGSPTYNESVNGYGPSPPKIEGSQPGHWSRIAPAKVDATGVEPLPTDQWPFLYLKDPAIPSLNLRGILIVAGVSAAILLLFAPVRTARPDGRMFFLGAGFMLLETKAVVHLALLFGSTWVVNAVVFFAILVMVLLGNLLVQALRPRTPWVAYSMLAIALLINAIVPMSTFLSLPGAAKVVASCAVVGAPVLFAGVIFSMTLRDSLRPDVAVGSNIAGAILGGLAEFTSLVVGFDRLLFVALVFYALSAILGPRRAAPVSAGPAK